MSVSIRSLGIIRRQSLSLSFGLNMTSHQARSRSVIGKLAFGALAPITTVLVVYFGAYTTIMDRRVPAQDDDGKVLFSSSYRWGFVCKVRRGETSIDFMGPTLWNHIFYPADRLFDHYGLPVSSWPTRRSSVLAGPFQFGRPLGFWAVVFSAASH